MAPPSKRPKHAKIPKITLSAPRVLNSNTPILSQDIHGFITTALSPAYWSQYSEEEKRKLIDLFPAVYRAYDVDADGKLECPVSIDFLQSDTCVKAGVARFKRDIEAGCWETKWQEQARKATQERKEGKFDEYLRDHAEECFGEDSVEQAEEDASRSGSDWEREHPKKKELEEQYVVERLLRQSKDGSRIEVKWHGYEETTWESRTGLVEDLPDMVAAMEARQTGDREPAAVQGAEHITVQGNPLGRPGRVDVEQAADGEVMDVVMD
jgi:hypothetical protein